MPDEDPLNPAIPAEATLPDAPPDASDELATKVKELETQVATAQSEKDRAEKEAKAAKEKMYNVLEERAKQRHTEPESVKVQKTYDQYKAERVKDFEENPSQGFGKFIDDVASDREMERQRHQTELKEVEERAYRRAMAANPEYVKEAEAAERLVQERPDLSNLTLEQRIEFVRLKDGGNKNKKDVDTDDTPMVNLDAERELLSGRVNPQGRSAQHRAAPAWVDDPIVLRQAQGFKSKKELLDWRNASPEQAMALARAERARQLKAEAGV